MTRVGMFIMFGVIGCWAVGCSSSSEGLPPTAPIKGTITMDAQPIATGEVHFGMAGQPPQVCKITNGTYEGVAFVGKNLVEVFVYADGPPSEKNPSVPTRYNTTPERYWGPNSTLQAEVTGSGPNVANFELVSR